MKDFMFKHFVLLGIFLLFADRSKNLERIMENVLDKLFDIMYVIILNMFVNCMIENFIKIHICLTYE